MSESKTSSANMRSLTDKLCAEYERVESERDILSERVRVLETALHQSAWELERLGATAAADAALRVYRGAQPG